MKIDRLRQRFAPGNHEIDTAERVDTPPNSYRQIRPLLRLSGEGLAKDFANFLLHGMPAPGCAKPKFFLGPVVKLSDEYAGHVSMISLISSSSDHSLSRLTVVKLLLIACVSAMCFLSAQTNPAFDAASILQSDPNARGSCGQFAGGRFNVTNCPLLYIIEKLYDLREFQVANAPKWTSEGNESTYTIRAIAADSVGEEQLRLMAEQLLADRFRFRFHRELRSIPVYVLGVAKNGSKLHVAADDGFSRGSGGIGIHGQGWIEGTNVSLAHFVDLLSGRADRPVIDKTGFSDPIDFNLRWAPDSSTTETEWPSLFTALQEQLGLKLEPQNLPIEILVIDHVEKPSPN